MTLRAGWFVLALSLAACKASEASPRDAGAPGPLDASTVDAAGAFGGTPCGNCLQASCAAPIAACTDDPDCVAYFACFSACGLTPSGSVDPTCVAACPEAKTDIATNDEEAIVACVGAAVSTCLACVRDAGSAYAIAHESCPQMKESNACDKCEIDTCCHVIPQCFNDPACASLTQCFGNCPADDILPDAGPDAGFFPSCNEACLAMYPTARTLFIETDFCFNANCAYTAPCGTPDVCSSCINSYCSQETFDMNMAEGGFGIYNCITECGFDPTCQTSCEEQFASAAGALDAFFSCQEASCAVMCPGSVGL